MAELTVFTFRIAEHTGTWRAGQRAVGFRVDGWDLRDLVVAEEPDACLVGASAARTLPPSRYLLGAQPDISFADRAPVPGREWAYGLANADTTRRHVLLDGAIGDVALLARLRHTDTWVRWDAFCLYQWNKLVHLRGIKTLSFDPGQYRAAFSAPERHHRDPRR